MRIEEIHESFRNLNLYRGTSNNMCETLAIKVKTLNLLLIVVYRPPNSTLECFEEAMNICQKAIDDVSNADAKVKDILMMGDFNLPCISWPSGKIYDRQVGNKSKEKQQAESLVNNLVAEEKRRAKRTE